MGRKELGNGEGKGLKTYLLNGWPQRNVVEYFLCIGPVKYTKARPPITEMSLFSSIIITIILSYAINRLYTILHIYLEVSETKGLAELHCVIGLSGLEKINSIYFQGMSLMLSKMFFGESECDFKNPNVLNVEASSVTSLVTS